MPSKEKKSLGDAIVKIYASGHGLDGGRSVPCKGQYDCVYCGIISTFMDMQNVLVGRILTVIDGSVVNEQQNKAVKDIAKQLIWDALENHRQSIMWSVSNFVEPEYKEAHSMLASNLPPLREKMLPPIS